MPSDPPSTVNPETVALVQRYQGGDGGALDQLVRRFYPRVQRIVRVRLGPALGHRVPVEDLVQNTFVRALRALKDLELRPDGKLVDFLARLAEREIANAAQHLGRAKRDVRREVPVDEMRAAADESQIAFELMAETTAVPEKVAKREMEAIVDDCLGGLDEAHREVILLRDYAQLDWPSVAEQLGRPSVGAAQQLYRRARHSLGEAVARRL
jgi:RNA polymerase sigma-70 factor (subfamily 1)